MSRCSCARCLPLATGSRMPRIAMDCLPSRSKQTTQCTRIRCYGSKHPNIVRVQSWPAAREAQRLMQPGLGKTATAAMLTCEAVMRRLSRVRAQARCIWHKRIHEPHAPGSVHAHCRYAAHAPDARCRSSEHDAGHGCALRNTAVLRGELATPKRRPSRGNRLPRQDAQRIHRIEQEMRVTARVAYQPAGSNSSLALVWQQAWVAV